MHHVTVSVQSAKIVLLEPFFYVVARHSESSPIYLQQCTSLISTEPVSPGVTFLYAARDMAIP